MENKQVRKSITNWGIELKENSPEKLKSLEKDFRLKGNCINLAVADYIHEIRSGLDVEEATDRLYKRAEGQKVPLYHRADSKWLEGFFETLEKIR